MARERAVNIATGLVLQPPFSRHREGSPVLDFDDLYCRYGDVVALDGLTFSVPAGQVFGFLGPNGAGKTTAMRAVFGIAQPERGEVRWRGRKIDPDDLVRFGYMPEERGLYPSMRVLDELVYLGRLHGMTPHAAAAGARHWLEVLNLGDRADSQVDSLSLGNQQRVQLAAALLHDPEVLILDEPFSGLDPIGMDAMAGVLRQRAAEGAIVLFSSHQLDLVEHLCESVAIVNRGRVVRSGRVDDLTTSSQMLLVEVKGDPDGSWAQNLPGARLMSVDAGRVRLALEGGTDPQTVLDAARAAGAVTHFAFDRRKLSEVFVEAVAA
ncbi:MAG: type transport system ATP-binding protein [Acidimicrobiaceae bacterium]|jgi:ABC-2 type transport system ATP-binding protein|nr:type transport system ATP-binding protein [Acidimicrobiaceae bacterium]